MAKQSVFDAPLALGLASKDEDVLTAKRLFNQLGRLPEPPRGFGNRLDHPLDDTVRAFQRDSGILEDGLINPGGATDRNIRRERGELPNEPPLDPVELDIAAPIGNGLENKPEDIIGISKVLGRLGLFKFDKTKEPSPIISTRLVDSLKDVQRRNGLTPTGEFKPGDKTDAVLKAEAEKLLGKKPARGRFDLDAVSKSANKREDEFSARRLEEHARDPRRRSGRLLDTLEDARDSARRRNDARDLKNPDRDIFDENDAVNLRDTQSRAVQMAKALDLDPDPDLSERSIRSKSLRNLADRIAASFEPVDNRPLRALKGTTFFAGAGFEGAYVQDFPKALAENGVTNARAADAKRWSNGSPIDQIATLSTGSGTTSLLTYPVSGQLANNSI